MGDTKEPLTFGPSERYLPALQEGDALTFELNSSGKDVDTEWGSKIQFSLTVLTVKSSLIDIKARTIYLGIRHVAQLKNYTNISIRRWQNRLMLLNQ